MMTDGVGALT